MLIRMGGAALALPVAGAAALGRSTTTVARTALARAPDQGVDLRQPDPPPPPRKPVAISSGVSSGTTVQASRAAMAVGPYGSCGPPPPGAIDARGGRPYSKDPVVLAWRACAAQLSSTPAPAAAPPPPPAPAAVSYAPTTEAAPPGAASYPASYPAGDGGGYAYSGPSGAAADPGAPAAPAGLTQAPAPVDAGGASSTSTGLLVGVGVAALAVGLGIYLAVR